MIKRAYVLDLRTGAKYPIPNTTECYNKEFADDLIIRFDVKVGQYGIYRSNRYRIVIEEVK